MWSALWIAVDSNGVHHVYREFPSVDEFGYSGGSGREGGRRDWGGGKTAGMGTE